MFDKTSVLDTNIFLTDPVAIFKFDGENVFLPITILEELDAFKGERNELGRNARMATKILEKISALGSLEDGVLLNRQNCNFPGVVDFDFSIFLKVFPHYKKDGGLGALESNVADHKILSFCLGLNKEFKHSLWLITKDINLRVKARSIGLNAKDYDYDPSESEDYKGWREEYVEAFEFNNLHAKNLKDLFCLKNLRRNEFLLVRNSRDPLKYKLFRYASDQEFHEITKMPDLWGFKPKNAGQEMALNLLLDDSVQLVFLTGPAGTGKTLLTMLAALRKTVVEDRYAKIFVAKPLVSLGADIGFIPGDLQEKLFHWMHPFYDNLEYIFDELKNRGEYLDIADNGLTSPRSRKQSRSQGRGKFYQDKFQSSPANLLNENVELLKQHGYLSMEAITHMRGRSLPKQFIFIDEAQNLTSAEVKTIISRAGQGTKIVLAGDPYQIDSNALDFFNNGLVASSIRLRGESIVGLVFMDTAERSDLSRLAIEKL